MRLLIDSIDWEYPAERRPYKPGLWDLNNENALMSLYLEFANGVILELRAEAETQAGMDRFPHPTSPKFFVTYHRFVTHSISQSSNLFRIFCHRPYLLSGTNDNFVLIQW